jgi:hypothetical protein
MRFLRSLLAGCAAVLAAANAFSHHSFSAEFDVGRPVALAGTVTKFEWTNPHAWLHLETKDAQGNVEQWAVEMLGVNSLIRNGMNPQTVKTGDLLTVTGFGSRDGTHTANASSVQRTETGETLWTSDKDDGN